MEKFSTLNAFVKSNDFKSEEYIKQLAESATGMNLDFMIPYTFTYKYHSVQGIIVDNLKMLPVDGEVLQQGILFVGDVSTNIFFYPKELGSQLNMLNIDFNNTLASTSFPIAIGEETPDCPLPRPHHYEEFLMFDSIEAHLTSITPSAFTFVESPGAIRGIFTISIQFVGYKLILL